MGIQTMVGDKQWVPGPGAYKTEREFLFHKKDEVDTNMTIQETAPNFTFSKEIKETALKQKDVKVRRNNGSYPKLEPEFNPGPGAYAAYTTFGTASGGSREAFVGGTASHNWKTMDRSAWSKFG